MAGQTVTCIDRSWDYNFHLMWQKVFHAGNYWAVNSVAEVVGGVIQQVGRNNFNSVAKLKIFGHGWPGNQRVGGGQSTPIQLAQVIGIDGQTGSLKNQAFLALLKPYLQRDGVVQLHGCRVAEGPLGKSLLFALANLWDCRVQAAFDTQYPDIFEDDFEGNYYEYDGGAGYPKGTTYLNS